MSEFIPKPDGSTRHSLRMFTHNILSILKKLGYNIKCSNNCLKQGNYFDKMHDWSASNGEFGVRLKIKQVISKTSHVRVDLTIHLRNTIGKYKKHGVLCVWTNGKSYGANLTLSRPPQVQVNKYSVAIQFLKELRGLQPFEEWRTIADLPEPYPFRPAAVFYENSDKIDWYHPTGKPIGNCVVSYHFFEVIESVQLVTINNDLVISEDIENPGSEIWYLIMGQCRGKSGNMRYASIIVNSDITGFYVIIGKWNNNQACSSSSYIQRFTPVFTITPNMTPHETINYHMMSELDQQSIELAVRKYVNKLWN